MNWLMYIFGGWLWIGLWFEIFRLNSEEEIMGNKKISRQLLLATLGSWVWICLKLIK